MWQKTSSEDKKEQQTPKRLRYSAVCSLCRQSVLRETGMKYKTFPYHINRFRTSKVINKATVKKQHLNMVSPDSNHIIEMFQTKA
ncbi:hypothetical protein TNCV_151851 [Trichonephila clavipes]|uniref:Uncharacterized protein n=1 Tax=Trichonephila clavipes TaxID=2585209 RepID=A0A8X6RIU9_TRICX|nr:hypothetical protein TNCV_151851 [Trichonephila clavipes]